MSISPFIIVWKKIMSLEATQYSCSRNDVCQRVFEGDVG